MSATSQTLLKVAVSILFMASSINSAMAQAVDPPTMQREMLNSTLWVQRAPEFQLAARIWHSCSNAKRLIRKSS